MYLVYRTTTNEKHLLIILLKNGIVGSFHSYPLATRTRIDSQPKVVSPKQVMLNGYSVSPLLMFQLYSAQLTIGCCHNLNSDCWSRSRNLRINLECNVPKSEHILKWLAWSFTLSLSPTMIFASNDLKVFFGPQTKTCFQQYVTSGSSF